jgi:F-type H+-transporting ATPase subunit a
MYKNFIIWSFVVLSLVKQSSQHYTYIRIFSGKLLDHDNQEKGLLIMNDFSFLSERTSWFFLKHWSITHWFFKLNAETVIATWAVFIALFITTCIGNYFLKTKNRIGIFFFTSFFKGFIDLCTQTLGGRFYYIHISFITTLFIFILYCNTIALIPFFEEPTNDLNTTLALGIFGFLYTTYHALKKHGFKAYVAEYFEPFFLMFPLHVVGKIASIISISFRLFGNLLGGSVITKIFMHSVGSFPTHWALAFVPIFGAFTSILIYTFFGIFEGFIQAFVFAMLSLTYLSTEIAHEE